MSEVFLWAIFGTPIVALGILIIAAFIPGERRAALCGAVGGPIGFAVGACLGGGFGQTEGWGWGNVGATLLGISYGGTGILISLACCWMAKNWRLAACTFLLAAILPLIHFAEVVVRPAVAKSQMEWWHPILKGGYFEASEDSAKAHLSEQTRQELNEYVYRHATGDLTDPIAPSALNLLYDLNIPVSTYNPLPSDLAERIYAKSPGDLGLARNPSTPEAILAKIAQQNDQTLLLELARNKGLPAEVAGQLRTRYEATLAEETTKPQPNYYLINTAREGLKALSAKTPQ